MSPASCSDLSGTVSAVGGTAVAQELDPASQLAQLCRSGGAEPTSGRNTLGQIAWRLGRQWTQVDIGRRVEDFRPGREYRAVD